MKPASCPVCKKDINKNTRVCPYCGEPQKEGASKSTWIVLALMLFLGYFLLFPPDFPHSTKPSKLTETQKSAAKEKAQIKASKSLSRETIASALNAVRQTMEDPDSAVFDGVSFHQTKEVGPVACGFVDSRNSFGDYIGKQAFISDGETVFMERKELFFSEVWGKACK